MTVRKKRRAKKYSFAHIVGLSFPYPPYTAFPEGEAGLEAMREAWGVLQPEVYKIIRERWKWPAQQIRPWAWWEFSSPEPRDEDEPEGDQLRRMGVELTPEEEKYIAWSEEALRKAEAKREAQREKDRADMREWNLKHHGHREGPQHGK